jgi:hypothetical protein
MAPDPLDNNPNNFVDEEAPAAEPGKVLKEFECPECNAHNPYDDGFTVGDEVRCYYCGEEFYVQDHDGRIKYHLR